jgi:hypothetical protein
MASTPAKNTKIYTEDLVVQAARGSSAYNRTEVRIKRRRKNVI